MQDEVIGLLYDVLGLDRSRLKLDSKHGLLGHLPEFDSMAVVAILTALEDQFGIAVSDRSGTIASPLTVVQRSGDQKLDHRRIAALVLEVEAEMVVVGLPLNMNGTVGPAAEAALAEADVLATVVGVPVETYDERRSTVTADSVLMEFKMKAPARRKVIDKASFQSFGCENKFKFRRGFLFPSFNGGHSRRPVPKLIEFNHR